MTYTHLIIILIYSLAIYPPLTTGVFSISINEKDYKSHEEGVYLNDTIIDFYLKYLFQEELTTENQDRTYVFSSFFFTRLMDEVNENVDISSVGLEMHGRVKRWTKNVNLFQKEFVIIPICQQ